MRSVYMVGFPSNLGLKEPKPGKEPGVKYLPEWLKEHGLHDLIGPEGMLQLEPPGYNHARDPETGILNADQIAAYSIRQSYLIKQLLSEGRFPFVTGGDCSILIGSAIALKQMGRYALFYLDGHTDFMDISLSETGGAGGMAASMATGHGHRKITDILGLSPYIREEDLWCVGNREYDERYENEIRRTKAVYLSLEALRKEGIDHCMQAFLKELDERQLDGFWLHIDVDVLNDEIMPCVDSRTPDGLSYREFNRLTAHLFGSGKLAGLEITILDPDLDPSGKYTKEFVANIAATFNGAML